MNIKMVKEHSTLHRQNTTAIDCYDQLKPNLQEAELLSSLLPKERIDPNACTLGRKGKRANE